MLSAAEDAGIPLRGDNSNLYAIALYRRGNIYKIQSHIPKLKQTTELHSNP